LKHNATGGTVKSYVDIASGERVKVKRRPGQVELLWEAWQLACEDVVDAYLGWRSAGREDRADAYCAYVAAADREAAAEEFVLLQAYGAGASA
jgi:hypothetical protein